VGVEILCVQVQLVFASSVYAAVAQPARRIQSDIHMHCTPLLCDIDM
jgi:hypothetical protein